MKINELLEAKAPKMKAVDANSDFKKIHDEFNRLYVMKRKDLADEIGPIQKVSNGVEFAIFNHLSKKFGTDKFNAYLEKEKLA